MPLPDTGTAWPPAGLAGVFDSIREWDAWYVGDPDTLRSYYGGGNTPSSSRGGIVGALARWFWGRPNERTDTRDNRLHLPIAADIASTSADLLFGEELDITSEDAAAVKRLAEIADDGLYATLHEAAEIAAALSGVYLRVVWDKALANAPWLDAVHPDAAVPEWRWGRLSAVTFWRILETRNDVCLRLLERHERGRIEYGLYQGTKTQLGRRIPLTDSPETESLAKSVDTNSGVPTAPQVMTAAYIPNMRPNRRWRTAGAAAHLGRSDLDGVEHLMDALDEVWSSWMRDIRLGKGRLFVPGYMLQSKGRGQGAAFDPEREVFTELNVLPDSAQQLRAEQFAIRVAEHQQTAQALVEEILRTAGYSAQTFGMAGDGAAATATEIVARQQRSYLTRDKKIRYWRPALSAILEALLAVDRAQFGTKVPEGASVQVHFPDGVSESPQSLAQTVQLLHAAEAASTKTKVQMLHPDWEGKQVDAEVVLIRSEAAGTGEPPEESLDNLADQGAGEDQADEHDDQGEEPPAEEG